MVAASIVSIIISYIPVLSAEQVSKSVSSYGIPYNSLIRKLLSFRGLWTARENSSRKMFAYAIMIYGYACSTTNVLSANSYLFLNISEDGQYLHDIFSYR